MKPEERFMSLLEWTLVGEEGSVAGQSVLRKGCGDSGPVPEGFLGTSGAPRVNWTCCA